MTTAELISGLENKRAASYAAANDIQNTAATEGRSKDDAEREKWNELMSEVKSCDLELADLREMEKFQVKTATPITAVTDTKAASDLRGGRVPQITITPQLPKGTAFTRYAMALASAKGDSYRAIERAKSWTDTPEVETMVRASLAWENKAAVAAGTTTDSAWAGPLAVVQPMVNEFLELLRPETLIDSVQGFRPVPFNVSVPAQTGGGTYSWVGQGNAKPVTSATFATVSVGFAKASGIIVLTEELVRLSNPRAEETIRREMIAGVRQFLDGQLTTPAVAAVANVNPASITNGAPTAAASGSTAAAARADIVARIQTFTAAELSLSESEIWLNESNAFALANALNALGQPLFPGFTGQTGSILMGLRARVTNVVGTNVILVHTPSILFADDGGVNIDASREASLQMDSTPANPSDATTVLVSLWQRNMVGLRAERFISWTKARSAAVTYISAAAYTGA
jgi:HK97 family phage major capsid protein